MEQEQPQANPWVIEEGRTTGTTVDRRFPRGAFARDAAIVCGLVIVTSVITDVIMRMQGYVAPLYLMSIPTKVAFIAAGAIVGCLTRRRRFYNLLYVGLVCWVIGFPLVPIFGLPLVGWGVHLLILIAMLCLGGIVSLMIVGEESTRGLKRY